jgi:hypothetical protein
MAKFAVGKNAYGISDRSGFRYKLNEMKREWNGLLVGKDEWEPKQPQLEPRRSITDPQALRNPRPDRVEPMNVYVGLPIPQAPNLRPVTGFGQVGSVTVVIS